MKSGYISNPPGLSRRSFNTAILGSVGALLPGLSRQVSASTADFEIIDFHSHFVPSDIELVRPPKGSVPPAIERVFRSFKDREFLDSSFSEQGINKRIINAPLEALLRSPGQSATDLMQRLNDGIAEICAQSQGRLMGLACIHAYSGEAAAEELDRAVKQLGLAGAFVESAHGDNLISAEVARPALDKAAALGVPVFVHPVQDEIQIKKYDLSGFYQTNLARSSINSIALADMLESGIFDDLPSLQICVSTFAISAILFGGLIRMTRPDAAELLRKHVYVDTVGVNPTLIKATSDVLGVEHILLGTDWPVFSGYNIRNRLIEACKICGFNDQQRDLIASGNARRLLNHAGLS